MKSMVLPWWKVGTAIGLAMPAFAAAAGAPPVETATLAGGCFWCLEEIFRRQPGVLQVTSGYTGGTTPHPRYEDVARGDTGHAEAVQIRYDPRQVSYSQLLEVFWRAHDPTQLNRQGADIGPQYRSAIFVHSDQQEKDARMSLEAENRSGRHRGLIVTEIVRAGEFYPAEEYHQGYYRRQPQAPYCRQVIGPKLRKLGLAE